MTRREAVGALDRVERRQREGDHRVAQAALSRAGSVDRAVGALIAQAHDAEAGIAVARRAGASGEVVVQLRERAARRRRAAEVRL